MSESGFRVKRKGELGFPFDNLYINGDFLFKEMTPTVLELRDFADTTFRSFRLNTILAQNIVAYIDVEIANLYLLKDIGGDLSLRNIADDTYLNFACNSITLGVDTGLSHSGTGVIPGLNGTRSLRLPQFTTVEKNALTPIVGDMVYDTTLQKGQIYEGLAPGWVNLV